MGGDSVRRFGDPSAPRWLRKGVESAARPILLALSALLIVTAVLTTQHWISVGDLSKVAGSVIGISIAFLILLAALIGWILYWRPLARAVHQVSGRTNGGIVVGARLPAFSDSDAARVWPSEVGPMPPPQSVVAVFNAEGATLYNTHKTPERILGLSWSQIRAVIPVEYVEKGRAYDGLALVGSSDATAIVIQLVKTSRPIVEFVTGEKLKVFAANVEALRE